MGATIYDEYGLDQHFPGFRSVRISPVRHPPRATAAYVFYRTDRHGNHVNTASIFMTMTISLTKPLFPCSFALPAEPI